MSGLKDTLKKRGVKILTTLALTLFITSCGNMEEKKSIVNIKKEKLTAEEKKDGKLTAEILQKLGRISSYDISSDGKQLVYAVSYVSLKENRSTSSLFILDLNNNASEVTKRELDIEISANSPVFSKDGKGIFFLSAVTKTVEDKEVKETQLFSYNLDSKKTLQLSDVKDGVNDYLISPDNQSVIFSKNVLIDETIKHKHKDLDKSNASIYSELMPRHWDYWLDGNFSHLFIGKIANGKVGELLDINEGEAFDTPLAPYFDMQDVTWSNNSDKIAYSSKKLRGDDYALSTNSNIYIYSLDNKSTICISEANLGYDKSPVFSPKDDKVVWIAQLEPGNEADKQRLFCRDINDKLAVSQDLTEAYDNNVENLVWEEDGENLFFVAPVNATQQIAKINIKSKEITFLTEGLHDIVDIKTFGGSAIVAMNRIDKPKELYQISLTPQSAGENVLSEISFENKDILVDLKMGKVEKHLVKTTDNKDMLTWIIYPPNYDANKKYPTLLYCQGGPQSTVSQFWSYRWNFEMMASQGYIVVAPNRRGLPSFGTEWLKQISGDYSGQNIQDYLSAIDYATNNVKGVDATKLGAIGASYGGYSVYYLAGVHNNRFKAFISHCGMYNMESFYPSTEELFFPTNDLGGAPWSDNAIAKRSYANSPHKNISKWNTPILILVGEKDYRIPYTESLQAYQSAKLRGVPAKMVVFHNENHWVLQPQNSLLWHREFFSWLGTYLK